MFRQVYAWCRVAAGQVVGPPVHGGAERGQGHGGAAQRDQARGRGVGGARGRVRQPVEVREVRLGQAQPPGLRIHLRNECCPARAVGGGEHVGRVAAGGEQHGIQQLARGEDVARAQASAARTMAGHVADRDTGTVIFRSRFPAWITTSAVMTLVTLPIGRLVPASRPHSSWPVPASASSAPSAPTPAGAAVARPPASMSAGRALAAGALARKVLTAGTPAGGSPRARCLRAGHWAARAPRSRARPPRRPGRQPGRRRRCAGRRDGRAAAWHAR